MVLCCGTAGFVLRFTDLLDPQRRALDAVTKTLARQKESLLRGDEAGYLSVLDAEAVQADRDRLARQFRSLRAMKVAGWSDQAQAVELGEDGLWHLRLVSSPCFVSSTCAPGGAEARTVWRLRDKTAATLVRWVPDPQRPHPWQVSELVAMSGERTVVATVRDRAEMLATLLAAAEKAAVVADRFAQGGRPPERYVVYWAPAEQWRSWFDRAPAQWVGGAAVPSSVDRYELILNADELRPDEVDGLLRHELTHAASLPGRITGGKELWWLMEGLAELAEMEGAVATDHVGLGEVAAVIEHRQVIGLDIAEPAPGARHDQVSGHYAFAFLAVRCIAERFGEPALVEYFHAVTHGRKSVSAAAHDVLGVQWPDLEQECLAYIHQAIG